MHDPLRAARARRDEYYYADGLNEIRHGTNSLFLAAMLLGIAARNHAVGAGVLLGVVAVMMAFDMVADRWVRAVRAHVTWRRVGYAEQITYAEAGLPRPRWVTALLVAMILLPVTALLVVFFVRPLPPSPSWTHWAAAVVGLALGAVHIRAGLAHTRLRRFLLVGAIEILLGIVCSLALSGFLVPVGVLYGGAAVTRVAAGAITLRHVARAGLAPHAMP